MIPRTLFAVALLAGCITAAPLLTTIQDVLYKADGTPFNGVLIISWNSFQGADNSAIAAQSTTSKVVNGNLRVQLVPTTTSHPPTSYTVTYNSDGRVQFSETWTVPSSNLPVRVRDVRTAVNSPDTGGADTASVQETDIVGLTADLGARPVKGPGYATGRTAVVNAQGAIETAAGSLSDCVHVDGSSGPCGTGGTTQPAAFVDGDSPAGIVDGANTSFTLSAVPSPLSSLELYRNGMLQKAGQDFNLAGTTVEFVAAAAPQQGDTLLAFYRYSGAGGSTTPAYTAPQILCSGAGQATTATAPAVVGSCAIPSGVLVPGDRVEVRFYLAHQGAASGFTFEVDWGGTAIVSRSGAAADTLVAGRADAAILTAGAQWSAQSWGTVLPLSATVGTAGDAYAAGLTVKFLGTLAQAGDTLTLANYTVVRLP